MFVHSTPQLPPAPYIRQAEEIVAGRFRIFDLECELGAVPKWNRDPLTGKLAPSVFAASIDYRDEQLVGNIKYLWEPNRHLHLPALAQAYSMTREMRYALAVRTHVDSWIEQCPCGYGPNWASSLELGIRLINWSIAWQLLGGMDAPLFATADGRKFRDRWLTSVYEHARSIVGKLSRFSSANNHLIGETAGVWIAAATWDYWPQLRRWGARCKRILQAEALRQNAPDGGNREQAFAYQQFVLDFLLLAGLAARSAGPRSAEPDSVGPDSVGPDSVDADSGPQAVGQDFAPEYWRRIESMLDFIASVMDVAGHVPMVGDADDGYVVRLSPEPQWDNYRSLLATGAVLFDRPDLARKAGRLDEKTYWLLGTDAVTRSLAQRAPVSFAPRRVFAESGYYLLGDGFETEEEIRMLVDAGPLGYLSIAAHGHADALGIVLNVGGREVLVDPGTYAYHTEPEWRSYFRSTRAHNTVVVDEQDQSRQSGNFMWSRHAAARCLQFDVGGAMQRFAGEHDGYERLEDPVVHRRDITCETARRSFTIVDTLKCTAVHQVSRHWHFAESVEVELQGDEVHARVGKHVIRLVPGEPLAAVQVFVGGGPLEGGWLSRGFGRKQLITTVVWRSPIDGTTALHTCIQCK